MKLRCFDINIWRFLVDKLNRKKLGGIGKGAPSGFVISLMVHAAAFLLAGMLVVFNVVKKEEKQFVPPKPIERPKMKLKKPKVKIKKQSKPKPTTRIVTKMNKASMPDIQLPEMSGMGTGLGGGDLGGFVIMPEFEKVGIFGGGQSIGNDFAGTFYDLKRDRRGGYLSGFTPWDMASGIEYWGLVNKFIKKGWNKAVFARYYRSPKTLYTTSLVAPPTRSSEAAVAFGDEDADGAFWVVHYEGKLMCPATHEEGITFRFWGQGDDFLIVRVNDEIVLGSAWPDGTVDVTVLGSLWESDSMDSLKYYLGNNLCEVGDWITLKPGESVDMEMLIGDWGGAGSYILAVEEEGVEYEDNPQGAPLLSPFKTAEPSHDLLDAVYPSLPPGWVCMTNGPVFCDYDTTPQTVSSDEAPEPIVPKDSSDKGTRTWSLANGRTVEAEFVVVIGDKIVLKNARGRQKKVLFDQLSAEDQKYVELACPPVFNINFSKKIYQKLFNGRWNADRAAEQHGCFGVSFKQTSAGIYNHDLQAEMFVIGKQRGKRHADDRYSLLDRQQTAFSSTRENDRFYEFSSEREVVMDCSRNPVKYHGYLITVTDSRGEMIAVETSHEWLAKNLKNLEHLKIGNYMRKDCIRAFPVRPKEPDY